MRWKHVQRRRRKTFGSQNHDSRYQMIGVWGEINSLGKSLREVTQETILERAKEQVFMAKNGQHNSSYSSWKIKELSTFIYSIMVN